MTLFFQGVSETLNTKGPEVLVRDSRNVVKTVKSLIDVQRKYFVYYSDACVLCMCQRFVIKQLHRSMMFSWNFTKYLSVQWYFQTWQFTCVKLLHMIHSWGYIATHCPSLSSLMQWEYKVSTVLYKKCCLLHKSLLGLTFTLLETIMIWKL